MHTIKSFVNKIILFIIFPSIIFSLSIKERIQREDLLMAEGIGGAGFLINTDKIHLIKKLGKPKKFLLSKQVFKTSSLPFNAREVLLYENPKRIFVFYDNKLQAIIVTNDANWHTLIGITLKSSINSLINKYGYNYKKKEMILYIQKLVLHFSSKIIK